MKIVSAHEMSRVEQLAVQRGAHEEAFMEEAGRAVADQVQRLTAQLHLSARLCLLCGSGNNGADAYVAGALLKEKGFEVSALATTSLEQCSPLCQKQRRRFLKCGGSVHAADALIDCGSLFIDGLLGTGFHGVVEGVYRQLIERTNASGLPIVAVDIPSGVDGTTGEIKTVAIMAHTTVCLGFPKTGCFLGEAWCHVGEPIVCDFGLPVEACTEAHADFNWLQTAAPLLPKIHRTQHKYERGYVIGVGGEMPGAPLLSSLAALRAGAGIVRLFHSQTLLCTHPEIICQRYTTVEEIVTAWPRASALFIGPGMGTTATALATLQTLLPRIEHPCVIDADALTLIAHHALSIPKHAILTPHVGEMKRLLNIALTPSPFELLRLCQEYSNAHEVILVLKGAPTFLFHPHTTPVVCTEGTPGMATAGSGDVLTGILAGVLAQIKEPWPAAQLGVYLHGLAGKVAAESKNDYSMIASDLIDALPDAFSRLLHS